MKKQWSDSSGLPVVVNEADRPLGELNATFIHPETGQIIGFLVGFTKILTPAEIERWRSDYVKVRSVDSLSSPEDILRLKNYGLRRTLLNSKKVCSKSGKYLGRVRDFCFDSATSSLLTFDVSKKLFWIEWNKRTFTYQEVYEVTDKFIRLCVEPEQKAKGSVMPILTAPSN